MTIYLPNLSQQSIGGGWTFLRTFLKYAPHAVTSWHPDVDAVLISGATMVQRSDVEAWKKQGKKIVLRVDNIPRNSRNRNTGTSRLYDIAQMADLVVYQSEWARLYISPFLKKDGPVILNGADHEIFRPDGPAQPKEGAPQYLYVQYNRDETKQWHQAWYEYLMIQRSNPNAHLWIAGNFSPELQAVKFDFFQGERFRYVGVIDRPEDMAEHYRGADIVTLPYFNDACSQTLIEARLCGAALSVNGTGGNPEILASPLEHLKADYMVGRYMEEIEKVL